MQFAGKTAVLTGAASGMGLLFAQNFAALGGNAVLCDVNEQVLTEKVREINEKGDCFDRQTGEMTYDTAAVEKQKVLIDRLHEKGASVLMSSHIFHFVPAEKVLEIALAHQSRGADIAKIVVGAENEDEEIENLRIIHMLKKTLSIPFLFLSGGECRLLRRIGGELGNCMTLCVCEHDAFATPAQPLLTSAKCIRDAIRQ